MPPRPRPTRGTSVGKPSEYYLSVPSYIPPVSFDKGIPSIQPGAITPPSTSPSSEGNPPWNPYASDPWSPENNQSIRVAPQPRVADRPRSRYSGSHGPSAPSANYNTRYDPSLNPSTDSLVIPAAKVRRARASVSSDSLADSFAKLNLALAARSTQTYQPPTASRSQQSSPVPSKPTTKLPKNAPGSKDVSPQGSLSKASSHGKLVQPLPTSQALKSSNRPTFPTIDTSSLPEQRSAPELSSNPSSQTSNQHDTINAAELLSVPLSPRPRASSMSAMSPKPVLTPIVTTFPSPSLKWPIGKNKPEARPRKISKPQALGSAPSRQDSEDNSSHRHSAALHDGNTSEGEKKGRRSVVIAKQPDLLLPRRSSSDQPSVSQHRLSNALLHPASALPTPAHSRTNSTSSHHDSPGHSRMRSSLGYIGQKLGFHRKHRPSSTDTGSLGRDPETILLPTTTGTTDESHPQINPLFDSPEGDSRPDGEKWRNDWEENVLKEALGQEGYEAHRKLYAATK